MTIQDIRPDQARLILPLLHQVHDLHLEHQPERYAVLPPDAELADYLQSWLMQPNLFTVGFFERDKLLGYAIFEISRRPASPFHPVDTRAVLHQISVDRAARRRGIGTALLEAVKSRLRLVGGSVLTASVASFNAPSQALMAHSGLNHSLTIMEWRDPSPQ